MGDAIWTQQCSSPSGRQHHVQGSAELVLSSGPRSLWMQLFYGTFHRSAFTQTNPHGGVYSICRAPYTAK
ncbi:hypothetical protein ROHU_018923 [Labeo rohita]|uniref:Uncharacterized protein n=1 Tax=Labeo rohita TaxID=84645 RepID=A0A498NBJ1_LABRO|nr:hypothetical protein ROHU_018923 [Labeo rohita]